VEGKGAGLADEPQAGLFRGAVALAIVAAVATGNQVFPAGAAAAGAREDMVERQFGGGELVAAELAGIAVAQEDVFAGKGASLLGDMAVAEQADHRRRQHGMRGGMNFRGVDLLGLSHALEHQDQRAANAGDVDGLVGCVQDEHGQLHHGMMAILGLRGGSGCCGHRLSRAEGMQPSSKLMRFAGHRRCPLCLGCGSLP